MFGAKAVFGDRHYPLQVGPGRGKVAHVLEHQTQVADAFGGIGVVLAYGLATDRQRQLQAGSSGGQVPNQVGLMAHFFAEKRRL